MTGTGRSRLRSALRGAGTRRVTASDDGWRLGWRPGLDQLRGLAIVTVLVGHGFRGTAIDNLAAVGVALFFTLSGFLITRLLLEEQVRTGGIDLRAFYARRARRLLPALGPALAFCAATAFVTGGAILAPVLSGLTYTTNFLWVAERDLGPFTHLWSLAVEEHFYLVFPAVVAAVPRRRLAVWCVAGMAVMLLGRVVLVTDGLAAYALTWWRADAMLVGAVLAVGARALARPPAWALAGAVAVLGWFSLSWTDAHMNRWGFTAMGLASAALLCAGLFARRRRPALEHLGRISYGVYLFHAPVAYLMRAAELPPWVDTLVIATVGIALAEVSWRLIEARWLARRPRPPAPVSPATSPAAP